MGKRKGFGIGEAGWVPATTTAEEVEAERLQPTTQRDLVRCDCGHTCPRMLVMTSSRGTCCPACYDRESE